MKKVQFSTRKPLGRLICPNCGNDQDFIEVTREVVITTRYVQNDDGSFSPAESDSEVLGEAGLYCGKCDADVSPFHHQLTELTF